MTEVSPQETGGLDRRSLLRAGLLTTVGVTVGVASPLFTGTAQALALQNGWYFCYACNGMYHGGSNQVAGICPATAQNGHIVPHGYFGGYTYNYIMSYNAGSGPDPQPGWYWCKNCFGMFYGGGSRSAGVCPDPNNVSHDGGPSYKYGMYYDSPNNGQPGWYWCKNCSILFHGGSYRSAGGCPYFNHANGSHDGSTSYNYNAAY